MGVDTANSLFSTPALSKTCVMPPEFPLKEINAKWHALCSWGRRRGWGRLEEMWLRRTAKRAQLSVVTWTRTSLPVISDGSHRVDDILLHYACIIQENIYKINTFLVLFRSKPLISSTDKISGIKYCNEFAGSISRWKFITLKIQYRVVNHNPQRF
jgi:hypothetical protein